MGSEQSCRICADFAGRAWLCTFGTSWPSWNGPVAHTSRSVWPCVIRCGWAWMLRLGPRFGYMLQAAQDSTGPYGFMRFLQCWISAVLSEASAVQGVDGCLQRAKPAGPATGCCCNIGALRCRPELCTPFAAAWTRKSETGKLHFLSFSCASAFNVVFGREMGACKPADALGICAPSRGVNRIRRCAWRFRKCAESNRSISS